MADIVYFAVGEIDDISRCLFENKPFLAYLMND